MVGELEVPSGRSPIDDLRERVKVPGASSVSLSRVASNEVSGEGVEQQSPLE